jgi:polar amino acid transport system permease protein
MSTIETLLTWLPFLFQGFVKNITIALLAMAIGTTLGSILALMKFSKFSWVRHGVSALTSFFRNVPTLVLLFYLATLLPNELVLFNGTFVLTLSPIFKASLALASSPLGFTAWNLYASLSNWRKGDHAAAMLFIPNWLGAFLVTTLASSVSSLVGVDELVSRSNSVITATSPNNMISVYLLAMSFFFVFCMTSSQLLDRLKRYMTPRS